MSARASCVPVSRRPRPLLGSATWEALGTTVLVRVTEPAALETARAKVRDQLAAIDLACSRFRSDSDLSRMNARAGQPTRVSPLLCDALALALRAAELTDGDVDPTIGRALELAGYDRDYKLLDSQPAGGAGTSAGGVALQAVTVRVRPGWRSISLDRSSSTVRVPRGVRVDLGATAKAWAADRAALAAALATGCGVLVSVGGDIATAGPAPEDGWLIHVTDDHRSSPAAPGQTITIRSGGLATSSTAVRRWRRGERDMHHIIDPATQAPADSRWRTVSVAAADCAQANIATTAALVRGARATGWLAGLDLPARLVDRSGHVTALGGWPAEPRELEGRTR